MGFVEDEDGGAPAFVFLGGKQSWWFVGSTLPCGSGEPAEGGDDAAVEAAAGDGWVAEVDDGVPTRGEGGRWLGVVCCAAAGVAMLLITFVSRSMSAVSAVVVPVIGVSSSSGSLLP